MRPHKSFLDVRAELDVRDLLTLASDVCRSRGVTLAELCGRVRSQSVARARQELWWLLRHDSERCYSFADIGRLFGRDHTTVMLGVLAHERRRVARSA